MKKGVLRNFAKSTGKHVCHSLFLNKVIVFNKEKKTLAQVFSCEFCEISKNTFLTEHLWTTASKASHLNNNKDSSHDKRYKKDIEKEEKMKNQKYKKSLTT